MASLLYACTKCHTKFPFDQLSKSSMLCSTCKNALATRQPSKICTYCREECIRSDEKTICMKCEQSESQYGKPRSCEICNIIAAFIGSKCKRCVVSETKWGAAVSCEQCKQRCAFNRPDQERQTDKTLCWLCTVAYKRVLAKAKRKEQSVSSSDKKSRKRRSSKEATGEVSSVKRSSSNGSLSLLDIKKSSFREDKRLSPPNHDANIVVVTQLREEVESFKKTLAQKERLMLQKDRKMTELKTVQMEMERHYKEKIDTLKSSHAEAMDTLRKRNGDLLRQIASLSKSKKLNNVAAASNSATNSPLI